MYPADGYRDKRWVSIKIMTADASASSHELDVLQSLEKRCDGNLGSKYIVQLLDGFTHQGPNGTHQCLVFELLGPTLDKVLDDYRGLYNPADAMRLEPFTVFKISEQLLSAIAFVHESGYVHAGIKCREMLAEAAIFSTLASTANFPQISTTETLPLRVVACHK